MADMEATYTKALVTYLTQFTDYLANEKIPIKDMRISKEFMEPLQWDNILADKI